MSFKDLKVGDKVKHFGIGFGASTPEWKRCLWYKPLYFFRELGYTLRKIRQTWCNGFPNEESFSFYSHCAEWSLPRLKKMRKDLNGFPSYIGIEFDSEPDQMKFDFAKRDNCELAFNKWKEILDKIIWSMENHNDEPDPIYPPDYDDRDEVIKIDDKGITFRRVDKRPIDWTPVEEHNKKVQEGFELFGKHFRDLWD